MGQGKPASNRSELPPTHCLDGPDRARGCDRCRPASRREALLERPLAVVCGSSGGPAHRWEKGLPFPSARGGRMRDVGAGAQGLLSPRPLLPACPPACPPAPSSSDGALIPSPPLLLLDPVCRPPPRHPLRAGGHDGLDTRRRGAWPGALWRGGRRRSLLLAGLAARGFPAGFQATLPGIPLHPPPTPPPPPSPSPARPPRVGRAVHFVLGATRLRK